jgi:hypothetical protein
MQTKLDELLSNYFRKDKKSASALITKIEISESTYAVAIAQEKPFHSRLKQFISSHIQLWNIILSKEKPIASKKEEIVFPEFLEFALKPDTKPQQPITTDKGKSTKKK